MSTALAEAEEPDDERPSRSAAQQDSNVPVGWKPTREQPVPVIRCTVIKRDGNRCGRWSLRGTTVCVKHGAQLESVAEHARAVVDSARMRLIQNTDLAVDTLEYLMEPGTAEGIRLKAATEVLDRAGIRGGYELDVEVTDKTDPREILARRLADIQKRALEDANIVEGEIIPDEDDEHQQDTLF